jgi:hypothetical protein
MATLIRDFVPHILARGSRDIGLAGGPHGFPARRDRGIVSDSVGKEDRMISRSGLRNCLGDGVHSPL